MQIFLWILTIISFLYLIAFLFDTTNDGTPMIVALPVVILMVVLIVFFLEHGSDGPANCNADSYQECGDQF